MLINKYTFVYTFVHTRANIYVQGKWIWNVAWIEDSIQSTFVRTLQLLSNINKFALNFLQLVSHDIFKGIPN